MKKLILIVLAVMASASLAVAQETDCYGWEDGGTVLGAYLPDSMYLANTNAQAFDGTASLEIYEIDAVGTPQAYVAWITNLVENDVVSATIQTYDVIVNNPSVRIWGHWTTVGGGINDYFGSAGGNNTYSGPDGWMELSQSWTVDAAHAGMGLVIEIRPYNATPFTGSNWIDHLCVTHPTDALVQFPGGPVGTESTTWGTVKALYN